MTGTGPEGRAELRIGLGCMRLSTDGDRDETRALATLHAALEAGVAWFDSAHAYGHGDADAGHGERLLARALASHPAGARACVVTKGGMRRPDGGWRPDGRAVALRADVLASRAALGGRDIDMYLLHAPDPRTPWATSVRALAGLVDAGLVRAVGVCNVSRRELDEALDLAPIGAVQVALSVLDDTPLRDGVVERCLERGLTVLAHSPLGGPRGKARLARDPALRAVAERLGVDVAQVALAWLLALDPSIVALPGARTPEAARAAAAAAQLVLDEAARARLRERFPGRRAKVAEAALASDGSEVVLLMGLQGAGKTRAVRAWEARGYERLNRDERGGTLRGILRALDDRLAAGARRVVLDNTYVTRAQRRDVIDVAWRHRLPVRCVYLDTPPVAAQVNVVLRMLAHHGRLLEPDELRRGATPESLPPSAHLRTLRELEPPAADEGFAAIDVVPFERAAPAPGLRAGAFVTLEAFERGDPAALARLAASAATPCLVFAWLPGAAAATLAALEARVRAAGADVAFAACVHPAGPPTCWCRPPLPGLVLAFGVARGVDPARSVLVGQGAAVRALAAALGASHLE